MGIEALTEAGSSIDFVPRKDMVICQQEKRQKRKPVW